MADQNPSPSGSGNVYAPPEARVDDVVPEGEFALADRGTRLGAAIVDGILLGALNVGMAYVIGINMFSGVQPSFGQQAILMVTGIVFFLLINGYLLAKNAQTVGKKLLKIKIARTDGSQATIGRIIGLRLAPVWVASAIPIVGAFITIIDVLFIFRENRKCIHDNIADTVVIKV